MLNMLKQLRSSRIYALRNCLVTDLHASIEKKAAKNSRSSAFQTKKNALFATAREKVETVVQDGRRSL
jgi:hypothetical protein